MLNEASKKKTDSKGGNYLSHKTKYKTVICNRNTILYKCKLTSTRDIIQRNISAKTWINAKLMWLLQINTKTCRNTSTLFHRIPKVKQFIHYIVTKQVHCTGKNKHTRARSYTRAMLI